MSWIVVTKSPHIKGVVRNEAKWFPKTCYSVWAVRYCSAAQFMQKRTMDKGGGKGGFKADPLHPIPYNTF